MWPLLLDMTKLECKKSLRTLELEAYGMIVTAFRAQGDLTQKKIELLKELQIIFKISVDRHKSELRRACNDDKLYTIAKLLSHGDCVSTEWVKQSKRSVPVLPSLQSTTQSSCYYRILADQILSKAQPVFSLYPEENKQKDKQCTLSEDERCDDLVNLKNGYAVDPKCLKVENNQPNEFLKRLETESSNSKTFLTYLIQKFKTQQKQAQEVEPKPVPPPEPEKIEDKKPIEPEPIEIPQNLIETTTVNKPELELFNSLDVKPQTLIPIQIPIQIQTSNIKLNTSQVIKLNQPNFHQKTPKLLIPASKPPINSQKLIILPSNSNQNGNLKILTMTQQSQKILLNVPSVTKPISDSLKRKLSETTPLKTSSSNSNLVCLKLDNLNDESNSSTSSSSTIRNGFYESNKKIKLIDMSQNSVVNLIKTSNSQANLTQSD